MENLQSNAYGSRSQTLEDCIRDCMKCFEECTSCINHCLSQGGKHVEQRHITLMMECAQICNSSASLMLLKGQFSFEHCQLCAKVCDACAASCSEVDPEDKHMQMCADTCRRCAESCRSMAH